MGEHRPYKPRVAGSNPVPPTRNRLLLSNGGRSLNNTLINYPTFISRDNMVCGGVVQFWLERRPVTPEVASSSLVVPASNFKHLQCFIKPFGAIDTKLGHQILLEQPFQEYFFAWFFVFDVIFSQLPFPQTHRSPFLPWRLLR